MGDRLVSITLHGAAGSGGTVVETVSCGGNRVHLGSPAACAGAEARLELALAKGFVTAAERDHARLVSSFLVSGRNWELVFDMRGYHEALDRV